MIESFSTVVDKLLDFSWRRWGSFILFLFLVAASVFLYGIYTDTFQLTRLERATSLLKELASLRPSIEKDTSLVMIYKAIHSQTLGLLEPGPPLLNLSPFLLRGLAAAIPWLIVTLMFLVSVLKGTTPASTVVGGIVFVAAFGLIGALVPDLGPNFNYVLYPIGHFLLMAVIVVLWQRRKGKKAA